MKLKISAINRFFNILFGTMAMILVALVSAFLAMRLAIHGHEVEVPSLTGLTLADAGHKTSSLGLTLTLENRFYSPNTPPGHVLAQSPAPGITVRREWPVRITESLGPQNVAIPAVIGQSERTASINIRRLALELGAVAHIQAPGESDVVLAQTPTADATGVDRPRVSLLLSAPVSAADDPESPQAIVMPSLAGLTLAGASARASAAGLRIVSAEDISSASSTPGSPSSAAAPSASTTTTPSPALAPSTGSTAQPVSSFGTVTGQTPAPGHRVLKGDAVHITLTD
jgi:eukaryotic-like serine/threonine-protein kinase